MDAVFSELKKVGVALEGMVLKLNLVSSNKAKPEVSAIQTLATLRRSVYPAVPGVFFDTRELVSRTLQLMNQRKNLPWHLSYTLKA